MADTGKLAAEGYTAGAIKYMLLDGFNPNPTAALQACLASEGYGAVNAHLLLLDGFAVGSAPPASGKVYAIFGGDVIA
jgi:hypothetical protein